MIRHLWIIIAVLRIISVTLAANQNGKNKYVEVIEVAVMDGTKEFIKVGEITTDSKNSIYVTDDYAYAIKKFSSNGLFQSEFGKRGKRDGEFNTFLFRLICSNDTLAVSELGSSRIQFFSTEWKFISAFSVAGTIVDIAFDNKSGIYASVMPISQNEGHVLLYDKAGQFVTTVVRGGASNEMGLNMAQLAVDRNNNLVVANHFINQIEVYDADRKNIAKFKVQGLPDKSLTIESQYKEIGSVPKGEVIKDIAIDVKGNIFVLTGDYATNPSQDIVVVDMSGRQQSEFSLPGKTGHIYIDNQGFLYTREKQRTIVKKYRIIYHGF